MALIKLAILKMLKDGEFEKIIKHARGRDKQNAKDFYDAVKDLNEQEFEKLPAILFIKACKSYNVWQDICVYMEAINNAEQNAEEA